MTPVVIPRPTLQVPVQSNDGKNRHLIFTGSVVFANTDGTWGFKGNAIAHREEYVVFKIPLSGINVVDHDPNIAVHVTLADIANRDDVQNSRWAAIARPQPTAALLNGTNIEVTVLLIVDDTDGVTFELSYEVSMLAKVRFGRVRIPVDQLVGSESIDRDLSVGRDLHVGHDATIDHDLIVHRDIIADGTISTPDLEADRVATRVLKVKRSPSDIQFIYVRHTNVTGPFDGTTVATAFASIRDALAVLPTVLNGQRILIECTGHRENFPTDAITNSWSDYLGVKMPLVIGTGDTWDHDSKYTYPTIPSGAEGELMIGAELIQGPDPDLNFGYINGAPQPYSTDDLTGLLRLDWPRANWTPNQFGGRFAQLAVIDGTTIVLPISSNTNKRICFAGSGPANLINPRAPIRFLTPSAEFTLDVSASAGLSKGWTFEDCQCSVSLFGLKITCPEAGEDPQLPLSVNNTKWFSIDNCILDGVASGVGNLGGLTIWNCVLDGGMQSDVDGLINAAQLGARPRRIKVNDCISFTNCALRGMIFDQQGLMAGSSLTLFGCGVDNCSPVGHGQWLRQAHANNYFDRSQLMFLVRWCHITNAVEDAVKYVGGSRSYLFETRIDASRGHGVVVEAPGMLLVHRVPLSAAARSGIHVSNGGTLYLRVDVLDGTAPPPHGEYGLQVIDGGHVLIQEDANAGELDSLIGALGQLVVGDPTQPANILTWAAFRAASYRSSDRDGSRVSMKLLPIDIV